LSIIIVIGRGTCFVMSLVCMQFLPRTSQSPLYHR